MKKIAIVGAGFSGAVIARELALAGGYEITVFDGRPHLAGNCHTERDVETGVMVHAYGPHIFHTSNAEVWDYVRQFDEFVPFVNRVKTVTQGRVFSLPINLLTINQFFGKTFSPVEAEAFMRDVGERGIAEPASFEEQALKFVGREMYEAFFRGYTLKQWGMEPSLLPASILKRLPIRFNYDDNYYASTYQGMPRHGYTHVVARILDVPGVTVKLSHLFGREQRVDFDHVFYSGAIDAWFDFSEGRLGYRTLDLVAERHSGDYQGNPVLNYGDAGVPYTRISEHKHFSPWESHENTIIFKEYSRDCGADDTPYYPIRLVDEKALLARYVGMARAEEAVTFVGRLGTYRYLDMHVTIAEALATARQFLATESSGQPMPAFTIDPLA
ncbi:MAG TPA: UDP-galactopyranose mutase [Moraxellaceae bacterium]